MQTPDLSGQIYIYICSSLTDIWGKITIGVTSCLSNLQTLLCYVASSQKCMAQMEGNYYFADNLLERTVGIHMLLSLRFNSPKLEICFLVLLAAFSP